MTTITGWCIIENLSNYSDSPDRLAFFSYIAGGFGKNIDKQIQSVADATGVNGSAISVTNMIKMVEQHNKVPYSHKRLSEIFSVNRQVLMQDLI